MVARNELQAEQDRRMLDAIPDALPRETREVAAIAGLSMDMTRRVLQRLEVAGRVAHMDGTEPGLPWRWRRLALRPDTA